MDQSHQKAEPRVKAAPKWARRRGDPQHAEGSAAGGQPAKAQNPVESASVAEAKATPAEEVAPARDGGD
eukprot:2582160-Pyramimonas_sp.AAC.1